MAGKQKYVLYVPANGYLLGKVVKRAVNKQTLVNYINKEHSDITLVVLKETNSFGKKETWFETEDGHVLGCIMERE